MMDDDDVHVFVDDDDDEHDGHGEYVDAFSSVFDGHGDDDNVGHVDGDGGGGSFGDYDDEVCCSSTV